jgi:hypothetical protein
VKGWSFTSNFKVDAMENYDERIAVVSALTHKLSKRTIIVIGTHLGKFTILVFLIALFC